MLTASVLIILFSLSSSLLSLWLSLSLSSSLLSLLLLLYYYYNIIIIIIHLFTVYNLFFPLFTRKGIFYIQMPTFYTMVYILYPSPWYAVQSFTLTVYTTNKLRNFPPPLPHLQKKYCLISPYEQEEAKIETC